MGDIINGDKIVAGNNSRIIKIEMKNYFGTNPKDESKGTADSGLVEAEDAEFEEVNDGQQNEPDKGTESNEKKLNYKSPSIVLQQMLEGDWFNKISTNKGLYNKEWVANMVKDFMASKYGAYIAKLWEHKRKIPKIKGQFIGTLKEAGVVKGSNLAIARAFFGFANNTCDEDEKKEANTFGRSIGEGKHEPYVDWIKDYVSKKQQKKE